MARGMTYLFALILLSIILFLILTRIFETEAPAIAFLLSMVVSHFILEKNEWVIDTLIALKN
ncbi:short-chain dehydrogenase [Alkalibacillus haloalkaliphilus]|uniref:short-chain dehydrogenase n=1 Tax=Alkalibacillus haloalkaliphilus TaxID=94136 RepID=UPI0029360CAD|nr:short-chain dehydrogenase [Alkalibacillus haloalkaliphilus]MDV2582041.1 short-chain dehydrogenase [Alkalibacillus haloalkaliphilus]